MARGKQTGPAVEELLRLIRRSGIGPGKGKAAALPRGALARLFARDEELELSELLAILDACGERPGAFFGRVYPEREGPGRAAMATARLIEDDEQAGLPRDGIGSLADLRRRRRECEQAIARLEAAPPAGEANHAPRSEDPESDLDRCRRLIRKADALLHQNPGQALREAERGRDLAAGCDRKALGEPEWFALQADAWSVLGSACRLVGDLRQAEEALLVALAFLDAPELQPRLDALAHPRLAQRAAYLRCAQGRFDEALHLNEEAVAAYDRLGERQRLGSALVDRGVCLAWAGRGRAAVIYLAAALEILDARENRLFHLAATHDMAVTLHGIAKTHEENLEALAWLGLACGHHCGDREEIGVLRLRMLEGTTAVRLGRPAAGIDALWHVHEGFRRLGSAFDQAIVLLRLAGVLLAQSRSGEVKRISGLLFPIFRHLRVDRETTAALMLFFKAAQAETLSQGVIEQATERIEQALGGYRLFLL